MYQIIRIIRNSQVHLASKRPRVLIFDEAVSSLDTETAGHFAHTVNKLKGKVTMLFITHQLPKALQVDEVLNFGMPEA